MRAWHREFHENIKKHAMSVYLVEIHWWQNIGVAITTNNLQQQLIEHLW